jgi:hypothetical protein
MSANASNQFQLTFEPVLKELLQESAENSALRTGWR